MVPFSSFGIFRFQSLEGRYKMSWMAWTHRQSSEPHFPNKSNLPLFQLWDASFRWCIDRYKYYVSCITCFLTSMLKKRFFLRHCFTTSSFIKIGLIDRKLIMIVLNNIEWSFGQVLILNIVEKGDQNAADAASSAIAWWFQQNQKPLCHAVTNLYLKPLNYSLIFF